MLYRITSLSTWALVLATSLVAAVPSTVQHTARSLPLAPLLFNSNEGAEHVKDSYVVVLKEDVDENRVRDHHAWVATQVNEQYGIMATDIKPFDLDGLMTGYTGLFDEGAIDRIRASEDVAYVEKDQIFYIMGHERWNKQKPFFSNSRSSATTGSRRVTQQDHYNQTEIQKDATWGIDRTDQRGLPLDKMYHYPKNAGQGVDIYVVDTGVNIEHKEFKRDDGSSRARWGATMPSGDANVDGNGHGSHVAGTAAGKTYGLAKAANVIAVKVLRSDGSGTLSDVIRGLEWVIRDHRSKQTDTANSEDSQDSNDNTDSVSMLIRKLRNKIKSKQDKKKRNKLSVANMSLGGGQSRALDQAVNKAVEAGVHFAVAAGNERSDACRSSPAGAEKPITVGASTSSDRMAMFSNLGSCVDIVAPGQDIKSIWNTRDGVNTISGTSMASPHVAGALAVYLSDGKEYASTQNLKEALISVATEDALFNIPRGTVNKLLFVDTSAI